MEDNGRIWVLVYKVKLTTKDKWITNSQIFQNSDLMLSKQDQLSRIFGKKNYKLIHYGCGSLEG